MLQNVTIDGDIVNLMLINQKKPSSEQLQSELSQIPRSIRVAIGDLLRVCADQQDVSAIEKVGETFILYTRNIQYNGQPLIALCFNVDH